MDYDITKELIESPQMVNNFDISDRQQKNIIQDMSQAEVIESDIQDGYDLLKKGRKFAIINKARTELWYFMQFNERKIMGLTAAYQILVWRRAGSLFKNIAGDLFWKYLVPKYDLICSDKSQTHLGHRFWQSAVDDALRQGLNVYLHDFLNPNKTKKILNSQVLYNKDIANSIWGNAEKYQARLLLISKNELKYDSILEEYDNFGIPLGI